MWSAFSWSPRRPVPLLIAKDVELPHDGGSGEEWGPWVALRAALAGQEGRARRHASSVEIASMAFLKEGA